MTGRSKVTTAFPGSVPPHARPAGKHLRADVVIAAGGNPEDGLEWHAALTFDAAPKIGGSLWTTADTPCGPERFKVSGAFSTDHKRALLAAHRSPQDLASAHRIGIRQVWTEIDAPG